ncbi:GDP dissociation inhibitor [Limtongia smithiae]|uniref:GDP dissociation inhibitor n=1 Tax=Limtongia smithiae TaxID=1125753 RepID=UPI0034CEA475
MDEQYDVIVLAPWPQQSADPHGHTGLTECILSGVLSVEGKKVLHIDRQDHYGGESASLSLTQIYSQYRAGEAPKPSFGRDRDWNVDLVPKFLMADGELINILRETNVTRYIEFKQIAGSYVFRDGRIAKVPASEMEAVRSPLMGLFEKRRMKRFFEFVSNYEEGNPSTHQGFNLDRNTMNEVYTKFGLESGTKDFIGHAMGLYLDDSYLNKPAREAVDRILLYVRSLARFGKSPYLYPLYGLGELPQGFARLSAIYGGTYMLEKPIDEIIYEDGVAVGVRSGDEIARAKIIIGDPTYFPNKVRKIGSVIRAICVLTHPIPNTDNADSVQIVIPQNQVGRKHDIYVAMVSSTHNVAAKGHYLAIVSTIAETSVPINEIAPALHLLGTVVERFVGVTDLFEPLEDGTKDHVYISKSYDATSHFETTTDDVMDIYERIEGKPLVLKKRFSDEDENFTAYE